MSVDISINAWSVYVVIALYVITYLTIDNRNIQRKSNQEEVANLLIQKTYDSVSEYVDIFGEEFFFELVSRKISAEEALSDNRVYINLKTAPFVFDERIFEFAKEGIITASNIQHYTVVKQKYEKFFALVVTFGDRPELVNRYKDDMCSALDNAKTELVKQSETGA